MEVKLDEEWTSIYLNEHGMEDENEELLELERVASIGNNPEYGYGKVIDPDGLIYSLNYQHYHGIVLAILHPELLEPLGYDLPREYANVFKYQRFMFAVQSALPYVMIADGMQGANVSKGDAPATEAQRLAVLKCLVQMNVKGEDTIYTSEGHCEANDIEKYLRRDRRE